MNALSIRQPYAELILRGIKLFEYRSKPTKIRGPVYIYASKHPSAPEIWEGLSFTPDMVRTGVIVGTVDIIDCKSVALPSDYDRSIFTEKVGYAWVLGNSRRFKRTLKPKGRPQPVWFNPFPK
jgi:predicted transcriptional regulator